MAEDLSRLRDPQKSEQTSRDINWTTSRVLYMLSMILSMMYLHTIHEQLDIPRFLPPPSPYPLQGIDEGIPREHHEQPAVPYILTPVANHHARYQAWFHVNYYFYRTPPFI